MDPLISDTTITMPKKGEFGQKRYPVYESSCLQNCLLMTVQNPFALFPLCFVCPISYPLIQCLPNEILIDEDDRVVLMSHRCGIFETDYSLPFENVESLQVYEFSNNCIGDVHACTFSLCNCSRGCFTAGGVNFRIRTTWCSQDIYLTPSEPKQLLEDLLRTNVITENNVQLVKTSVCTNPFSTRNTQNSGGSNSSHEVDRVVKAAPIRRSSTCVIL